VSRVECRVGTATEINLRRACRGIEPRFVLPQRRRAPVRERAFAVERDRQADQRQAVIQRLQDAGGGELLGLGAFANVVDQGDGDAGGFEGGEPFGAGPGLQHVGDHSV
jgi:hypothetical protein